MRLIFCYLKVIRFLHPCCYLKIVKDILKNCAKNKWICVNEHKGLLEMTMKMKNISQRYDINRCRPRHEHKYTNKRCFTKRWWLYVLSLWAKLEAQFMEKLATLRLTWHSICYKCCKLVLDLFVHCNTKMLILEQLMTRRII